MRYSILFLFLIFNLSLYSQQELRPTPYVNSSIIFKNSDTINGFVRLASSPFDIRFKDSIKQKRERKIKYKEIEELITYIDSLNPRMFTYKRTNSDRILHFVELIHSDTISIYVESSDRVQLFYADLGIDRRTAMEWMNDMRFKNNLFLNTNMPETHKRPYYSRYANFYSGVRLYAYIQIDRIDYYLKKTNQEKITLLGSNSLGHKFKKRASKYFNDCPKLIEKINNKEFKIKHLPEVIEFYKESCN